MPVVQERRYAPPVHMIKLTQEREIAAYASLHPDDDDRRYDRGRASLAHGLDRHGRFTVAASAAATGGAFRATSA
jgi:hypothetical protein